ncbi:MAG: hypothetical protein JXO72_11745 [Vicinamibacteria bacterium]|nr:hypothetical protein [Vicinamibacteria bacterium]
MRRQSGEVGEAFGCHGCSVTLCPSFSVDSDAVPRLGGAALVAAAATCFLTPLICALAAAAWLKTALVERNLIVLAGLIIGLLLAVGASRFVHARSAHKETTNG